VSAAASRQSTWCCGARLIDPAEAFTRNIKQYHTIFVRYCHNSNSRSDSGRLFFAAVSLSPDGFSRNLLAVFPKFSLDKTMKIVYNANIESLRKI
jgi:hypothetical protein